MNISDYGIMYTFEDWNQLIDWMMNYVFDRCIVDGKDKLRVNQSLTIDDCIHYLYRLRAISDDFDEHRVAHFRVYEMTNYGSMDTLFEIKKCIGKIKTAIELMNSGLTMRLKYLINENEPSIKIMVDDLPTLDDIIL